MKIDRRDLRDWMFRGLLFEALFSSLGLFYYHRPDLLGVPRWLPAIYLHVGLLALSLSGTVRARAARPG